jgi:hypothetical protein
MNIACLGWGSLIWDPRGLPLRGRWFDDGPLLPIEFARESSRKRITLVIADVEHAVRSLWALMSVGNLEEAKRKLAEREGITEKYITSSIGFWEQRTGSCHGKAAAQISIWADSRDLDAVVWTNLKCGFENTRGEMPKYSQILRHFKGLLQEDLHEEWKAAQEYVRRAPVQIDTEFRRRIEKDLGWTSQSQGCS